MLAVAREGQGRAVVGGQAHPRRSLDREGNERHGGGRRADGRSDFSGEERAPEKRSGEAEGDAGHGPERGARWEALRGDRRRGRLALRGARLRDRFFDQETRVAHVAEAFGRVLPETPSQELADEGRGAGRQRLPVRLALEDARERVGWRRASERGPAGERLEERAAERPDVRAAVHGAAARLLGAHVGSGSEDDARLGAALGQSRRLLAGGMRRACEGLREAEVEDLHAPFRGDDHVRGFQVAVNDARVVRRFERRSDLPEDRERFAHRHRSLGDPLGERLTLDELEGKHVRAPGRLDSIDRCDIRVIERREQSRLPLPADEPLRVFFELCGEDLECRVSPESLVSREPDLSHAASPERAHDDVSSDARFGREAHRPMALGTPGRAAPGPAPRP